MADFLTGAPTLAHALERCFRVYADQPHFGARSGAVGAFTFRTYEEVGLVAANLAAGMCAQDGKLAVPRRSAVAIIAENRPEWMITDFACCFGDFVSVGIHAKWGVAKTRLVLDDAAVVCVVCGTASAARLVIEAAAPSVRSLPLFDSVTDVDGDLARAAAAAGLAVARYADVARRGACCRLTHSAAGFGAASGYEAEVHAAADPDAVCTLMYSSGTSGGAPKAVATSKRVWRDTNCNPGPLGEISDFSERRVVTHMSLAHGSDRGVCWFTTFAGGSIGFVRGSAEDEVSAKDSSTVTAARAAAKDSDTATAVALTLTELLPAERSLLEGMRAIRPTFFLGLSDFWTTLYAAHRRLLESALAEALCGSRGVPAGGGAAHATAEVVEEIEELPVAAVLREFHRAMAEGGVTAQALRASAAWPDLCEAFLSTRLGGGVHQRVLRHTRAQLGGALLITVTGGSHTSADVVTFMSRLMSAGNESRVYNSYGSTEFPGISRNGEINDALELKLIPVEEREHEGEGGRRGGARRTLYAPTDRPHPRGEIVVRWKNGLQTQYWKRPELDKQMWRDGWFYTGDVGALDYTHPRVVETGPLLTIVDRVTSLEEIYWEGDSVWINPTKLQVRFFRIHWATVYCKPMRFVLTALTPFCPYICMCASLHRARCTDPMRFHRSSCSILFSLEIECRTVL